MKKIVVAPQIVIYQNIFTKSKEFIDFFENDMKKNNWLDWYNNGYRKQGFFDYNNNNDSIEFNCLKELRDNVIYIKEDYFNQFSKDNGNWDSYVKNWDNLQIENVTEYFKYDVDKLEGRDINNLLMEYHVDEYLLDHNSKFPRHVITINLYLNDDYEGGEVCVYDSVSNKSYKYKPQQGDIIVFPSADPFYHAVMGFKGNHRYYVRTFIDHPVDGSNEGFEDFMEKSNEYIDKKLQELRNVPVEELIV